ncbi:hypothetical protein [Sphingopyxis sp. JAI128]|uniref:hypothetical protein n=1 Tax=Sphingopyxis sp. JAI128 TaxID=2723066 RepID=UPI001607AE84|nr:hypothetical protein [Sphingopyxis sp. JAI128]MBB6426207.1 hypothetical protein [Sphingopyxis sp. JAI128]
MATCFPYLLLSSEPIFNLRTEIMYGMVAGAAYLIVLVLIYLGVGLLVSLPILLTIGVVFGLALGGLILVHGAVIWENAQAPGTALEIAMSFAWVLLFAAYFLAKIFVPAGLYRAARPAAAPAEVFA